MRPVGDEQPPRSVDAALMQVIQLGKEVLRLEYDPVADDAGDALVQDAGRDLPVSPITTVWPALAPP